MQHVYSIIIIHIMCMVSGNACLIMAISGSFVTNNEAMQFFFMILGLVEHSKFERISS